MYMYMYNSLSFNSLAVHVHVHVHTHTYDPLNKCNVHSSPPFVFKDTQSRVIQKKETHLLCAQRFMATLQFSSPMVRNMV